MKNAGNVVGTFRTDGRVWLLFLTSLITPDDTRTRPHTHTIPSQKFTATAFHESLIKMPQPTPTKHGNSLPAGAHRHVMNAAYQTAHRVLPQQRQKAIST